jgi:protein-S-isoprenylcysteine O-methyltransferase Ste14
MKGSINMFNDTLYPLIYYLIFGVDTAYFTFGYMFEAAFLGNRVRSVEPTVFGWIAALLCYPPFNSLMDNYIRWYAADFPTVSNIYVTFVLRIVVLLLFLIYLWATVSLGTKCSNLTNRGIVSRGPYSIVRHPAYISKNLAWFVSIIPVFSIQAILNMAVWAFLYYLRAITEERHLIKDPEYQQYCRKVRYRFIPYIW